MLKENKVTEKVILYIYVKMWFCLKILLSASKEKEDWFSCLFTSGSSLSLSLFLSLSYASTAEGVTADFFSSCFSHNFSPSSSSSSLPFSMNRISFCWKWFLVCLCYSYVIEDSMCWPRIIFFGIKRCSYEPKNLPQVLKGVTWHEEQHHTIKTRINTKCFIPHTSVWLDLSIDQKEVVKKVNEDCQKHAQDASQSRKGKCLKTSYFEQLLPLSWMIWQTSSLTSVPGVAGNLKMYHPFFHQENVFLVMQFALLRSLPALDVTGSIASN